MKLSPKAQARLSEVVAKFKSGDLSPIVKIARIKLSADAPASKWSFANQVLAYIQTGSLDCRGFRQWQESGRQVKKGTRAAFILAPNMITKDKGTDNERRVLIGFRAVSVHAVSDTQPVQGQPDITPEYMPRELPPLADVARAMGVELNFQPLPPDRLGECSIDGQRIAIGSHDTSIFFHELAHAAHSRLETLSGGQDGRQETVAEFTACVLMNLYGLGDRTGNAWDYISMYAKEPIVAVSKALATVEKVLALLESVETDLAQVNA